MAAKDSEIGSMAAVRDGSGPASWGEDVWHTAKINKYPVSQDEFQELESLIKNHCLTGLKPEQPLLKKDGNVVAIGSCFAAELRHFLIDVGLSSESFWVPSGLNNTFALLDFFSWAITGVQTAKGYAYKRDPSGTVVDWQPDHERAIYKNAISDASCFVFTLGLSEVWEDKDTGKIFWRGVPKHIFDDGRHQFRLSTSAENSINILEIVRLIRTINENAPIVFTLSPVPLKATFSEQSCISADCISKSILRVAIQESMSSFDKTKDNVYYWPSFEIVKWVGCHLPYPVYGTDDGCVRHVSRYLVNSILKTFVDSYYGTSVAEEIFNQYLPTLQTVSGEAGEPPLIYKGQIVKA